ncbi:MAG: dTDP-4-dehydrorhamnose 3,5-epimerase [Brumimicrobium sp.]|nr:dTDP-4-dehydrorhamnose 3,5-epimerase [Brumimicrobium sp.]MCO5267768.1 dTDP-4-dehydrorhamnose 3,5-epimerase [Brumimicrobium sp.]
MKLIETDIEGLFILEPKIYEDERGYFMESFNTKLFQELVGSTLTFVQDNESKSASNVLRGLHYQTPPFAQAKLVRVIRGAVLDVAVDLRKNSPTFGQHYKIILSEENKKQFFIPEGFAHGFLTLEEDTIFSYKCSQFYNKESERGIMWNDKDLAIDWDITQPILSEKDQYCQNFCNFASPF